MAADIAGFSTALDRVWKSFSSEEVVLDQKKMSGLDERSCVHYIEQKFQEQLQRARSAMNQEFKNHSVVVDSEVRKIREELTKKLDEQYGEQIAKLRSGEANARADAAKLNDEIARLKVLAIAQESYLTAVRHRYGFEEKEQMKEEIQRLTQELEAAKLESTDLSHQLMCNAEQVAQLQGDLSTLEDKLERQATSFADKEKEHDEELRNLRLEMRQKEDRFAANLRAYEDKFAAFKKKTSEELEIQTILNTRRSDALSSMEEERQRHIAARTKPTARIGERELEEKVVPYELAKGSQYRVDPMGMDSSWRDYQLGDLKIGPPGRKVQPLKFKVGDKLRPSLGPMAPVASEVPREDSTTYSARTALPSGVATREIRFSTPRQRWSERPPIGQGA